MSSQPGAKSLLRRAFLGMVRLLILQAVVLAVAAGTLRYPLAWVNLALQAFATTAINLYLLRNDPALLDRRLALEEVGESEPAQRRFLVFLRLSALIMLVMAGLDFRFGWSHVSTPALIGGYALFALGNFLVFLVLRENSFASSVIEIVPEQQVVSSGPYRWVRHPMYTGFLLVMAANPLTLGSYLTELMFLPVCALFVIRLLSEETYLARALPGYDAYLKATRARLVPGVW
jgi:protein-S-isoprenylcysteine O-methyltransferase Ste14